MKNAFYTSLDMLTISFVRTGLPGTFLELDRFDDEINITYYSCIGIYFVKKGGSKEAT